EIYEYEIPIRFNHGNKGRKQLDADEIIDILTHPERYQSRGDEYKKRNVIKAKNNLRRLAQANFDHSSKFLTLTFANTKKFDITCLTDCHYRLEYFIKTLRDKFTYLKYLAVPEFQDKNGRGAVHYH